MAEGVDRRIDRLTPADVSNLRVEDRGMPMHVAGLLILEGSTLRDDAGAFRFDDARVEIERRLHVAPRLRQILVQPGRGLGPPLWADDARFDIADHVGGASVASPGDEGAMLATCVDLNRSRLDRSRPLWEITFLTGLDSGCVGMLVRLHHAIADGVASVAMLGSLFDLEPDAPAPDAEPWVPHEGPSSAELRADHLLRRRDAVARLPARLAPSNWVPLAGTAMGSARRLLGGGLAPRSFLSPSLGARRLAFLARADLARAKAVAHAHGGKVNDVVLAAVAGGARTALARRGELTQGMELRASVPVSRRDPGDPGAGGNRVGVMIVPVPVGESDPIRRLERIIRATTARKRDRHAALGWDVGSPVLQRAVIRLMRHQRLVNLLLSNVPGPPVPMYFAGARVRELFQLGVIQGNVTIAVGALSYAGQLNFDIVADAIACPDAGVFAEGLAAELIELSVATPG